MIQFKNYSFRYEERKEFTLKIIDLTVQAGECILVTGRSGCGKSTLIRSLGGLIPHFYPGETKGELWLDGTSLLSRKPWELAGQTGTVFQDPRSQFFMTDSTRELAFGCENMGMEREETIGRVAKAVEDLELEPFLNHSIFTLSGGEKQQIAVGSVYALSPKVYIFDEPSANLDYDATRRLSEIMKKMKQSGCTILVAEHRFYYLRDFIDRVYLMEDGQVAQSFTREEFCTLDPKTRANYGLRTPYPQQEIGNFQYRPLNHNQEKRLLSVRDLSFSYKRGQTVLKHVSFQAEAGDVVGILGHNGAGKTTLFSIMAGMRKENSGTIQYNGRKLSPRGRRLLSYMVMQDADYQLFGGSVEEELSLGMKGDCSQQVEEVLAALELSGCRNRHPASLSGGQKQRVTIGGAIVKGSSVIYFDEPTSGLDHGSMLRVSGLIKTLAQGGRIIFVVSHDFEWILETCTQILELDRGEAVWTQELGPDTLDRLSREYFS